jgi:hypothetical protein
VKNNNTYGGAFHGSASILRVNSMKNILNLLQASLFTVSLTMVGMDKTAEWKERFFNALMLQEHRATKNMRTPRNGNESRSRSLRSSNKGEIRELNDHIKDEYERIKYHRS